jgi:hypothetical protein
MEIIEIAHADGFVAKMADERRRSTKGAGHLSLARRRGSMFTAGPKGCTRILPTSRTTTALVMLAGLIGKY